MRHDAIRRATILTRQAGRTLASMFVVALWLLASAALAHAPEIRGIALTVADLDHSVAFYEGALGFREVATGVIADDETDALTGLSSTRIRHATLQLNDERIELQQYLSAPGRPLPVDSRSNDLWFQHFAIVVRDMDAAYAQLSRYSVQAISSAPQTIPASNPAAAGIRAYKFRDPDGHPLELLQFPLGKGNPKWQRPGTDLFLGIDHSAITVASTRVSLRFWVDLLGLSVAGGSLNTGPAQAQLDGTPGAVVRITGLRAPHPGGLGLEFLQYLSPEDGRANLAAARPNDIAHVHVVLEVDDLGGLVDELSRAGVAFISRQPARAHGMPPASGVMVKDPDGHAVLLVRREIHPMAGDSAKEQIR